MPDGDLDGRRVAALGLARGDEVRPPLREALVREPEPGGVPGVRPAGGQAQDALALGGDQDRHPAGHAGRAGRRRDEDGVVDVVPAPVEGHPLAAEQRDDDPERLLEPARAVVERVAEGRGTRARASPCRGPGSGGRPRSRRASRPSSPCSAGGRKAVPSTIVPSSARSVTAATAASSVHASWMPSSASPGQPEDEVVVDPQAVDAARLGERRQLADPRPGAGARRRPPRSSGARCRSSSADGTGRRLGRSTGRDCLAGYPRRPGCERTDTTAAGPDGIRPQWRATPTARRGAMTTIRSRPNLLLLAGVAVAVVMLGRWSSRAPTRRSTSATRSPARWSRRRTRGPTTG